MSDTTRLSLPRPSGTDLISGGDNAITEIANTLDDAALFLDDVFASRPAAGSTPAGTFFRATDTGNLYLCTGAAWVAITTGAEVPIGGSLDYAGSGDPADTRFLLEDGRAISRATYATLFGIISTTYGAGNGTTTFNIPDSRGRVSVGPDDMGTAAGAAGRLASNKTLGAVGGAETKALATGELPVHAHAVGTLATASDGAHDHAVGTLATASDGAHTHSVSITSGGNSVDHTHNMAHDHPVQVGTNSAGSSGVFGSNGVVSADVGGGGIGGPVKFYFGSTAGQSTGHTHAVSGATASGGTHTHTISGSVASNGAHTHTLTGSTANTGSGTAFNIMQPYVVKNKIIRVL